MKCKLLDLAVVSNGYSFPERIQDSPSGRIAVLLMNHIPATLFINHTTPIYIDTDKRFDRYLLRQEDIIFRPRGNINTCSLLKTNLGLVLAAAPLMTIRVQSDLVITAYLAWWVNQRSAQAHFQRHARGTAGRMISREALESLEIPIPSLDIQQNIVELALLGEREQELMRELGAASQRKLDVVLMNATTEENNGKESTNR